MLDRKELTARYTEVRARTMALVAPLGAEDMQVQSMPDASPTKWHLAHTTWFFETFVLAEFDPTHRPLRKEHGVLFNSYYEAVGPQHPRSSRGNLSRPTFAEVREYRTWVDRQVLDLLARTTGPSWSALASVVVLGTHHEEQHQELILTDILHAFASNPLRPAYRARPASSSAPAAASGEGHHWIAHQGGLVEVGHDRAEFSFDNEQPRHRVFLEPFELGSRLVTNEEFGNLLDEKGYHRSELWLSDGYATVKRETWSAPLYWEKRDGAWWQMSLRGMRPLEPRAPVAHVSYYEAEAYAHWARARLPTEVEWEVVAAGRKAEGNLLDQGNLEPLPSSAGAAQFFGDTWEWTQSPYAPYPRFHAAAGALGEYNGKFMVNQMVLRGGSCLTPVAHIRSSYRNFFPPSARWQMSGIRLARSM